VKSPVPRNLGIPRLPEQVIGSVFGLMKGPAEAHLQKMGYRTVGAHQPIQGTLLAAQRAGIFWVRAGSEIQVNALLPVDSKFPDASVGLPASCAHLGHASANPASLAPIGSSRFVPSLQPGGCH
jgi:hypothetical protein